MGHIYIEDEYYIAVFESRNHAVQLYHYLNKNKYYQYELISTPCRIKAGCGYSIRFRNFEHYKFLEALATENSRHILALYSVKRQNGRRILNKLDLKSKK